MKIPVTLVSTCEFNKLLATINDQCPTLPDDASLIYANFTQTIAACYVPPPHVPPTTPYIGGTW